MMQLIFPSITGSIEKTDWCTIMKSQPNAQVNMEAYNTKPKKVENRILNYRLTFELN